MRTAPERETEPEPPRRSSDFPFDRCVIGEQTPFVPAPLLRPAHGRRCVETPDEDVVDTRRRRAGESPLDLGQIRERPRVADTDVEIAAEKNRLTALGHPVDEYRCAQELGIRYALVREAGRVEIPDDQRLVSALDPYRMTHTSLFAPRQP